jgi:16S rRNA (uracil1498-N3)-methyltransferase
MSEPWFYVRELSAEAREMALDAEEARHAAGARRIRGGEFIHLFDGRGGVARARLRLDGGGARAEILERWTVPMRLPAAHLCSALPKGDRAWTLISMVAQLGIASFTPLQTERGIVEPGKSFAQRAERIAIEACKQTRQAHVPVINQPARIGEICDRSQERGMTVWMAHPGGDSIASAARRAGEAVAILIGPEGGFTDEEVTAAQARGAAAIHLGENLVRIETAGVAVVSYLRLSA